jgi:regulator of RNase E activity RraA
MTEPAPAIRLEIPRPAPEVVKAFQALATTAIADVIELGCVMRYAIHPLWPDMPRIAGPAFTVRTAHHDNLMLHAAIYRAEPGDVIVVEAGDDSLAVAGGNVCAIAQRRGVAGFIVDGVIRDIAESRANGFPLFARGRSPSPGAKEGLARLITDPLQVVVHPGIVVADERGSCAARQGAEVLKKATAEADPGSTSTPGEESPRQGDATPHKGGPLGAGPTNFATSPRWQSPQRHPRPAVSPGLVWPVICLAPGPREAGIPAGAAPTD